MRKTLILALICFTFSDEAFTQNFNWITPGRTYLKMFLADDGIYRINKSDFISSGINTSNIDPRTVKVYYKGNQIPIFFFGEDDGIFNDNDYFDFYGMRNYGGLTYTYDQNNVIAYVTNEYFNLYSDTNLYWIDWGGNNGLRFSTSNYTTNNLYPFEFFYDLLHFEKDKIYSQGENVSSSDLRFLSTEKFKGEGWYWNLLRSTQIVSDTFSTPLLFSLPQNATIRVFAYSQNRDISVFNEHRLEVIVNGTTVTTLFANDINRIDTTISFSSSLLLNSFVNNVTLKYISSAGFEGSMYIDLFEIQYPKIFKLKDNKLSANLNSSDTTSKLFKISGYNSVNPINIYDVKNNFRITNFTNSFDTIKFTAKSNARIELINQYITKKPFRIKQKRVPNLVSNSNGTDYLLIYNGLFEQQAEQLRAYRQSHDNLRSFKTEIEDIYDIFNYGHENPVAIRNFVKYVYDNWQLPKIGYICLFGRGSLDPKRNSSTSIYYNNLIPVYGNPPSDGYFANLNIGSFFYYDQIAIGRLPAFYVAEAQAMVDKIIAYENEPPDKWWKTFTFITGGSTLPEQSIYQLRSNSLINAYILPPPISGEVHKIYRTDSSGSVTFNFADSIKNDINRGTSIVNYIGNAQNHYWDFAFQDPNVLSNGSRLPMILSNTSFTGENSQTQFRGYGEKFIYLNNKGAIGFVGASGFAFFSTSSDLSNYIFLSFRDSTRRMGDLIKNAGAKMSQDSLSYTVRHTINSFKLLGDPAVKLKLPKFPEFVIKNIDYKLTNKITYLNSPVTLTIFPKNFGLYADSCKIRFQLKRYNQNSSYKDTVYRAFKYLDTISHNFKIDSIGVYTMTVTLDQDNWYPLEDESNNSISFSLPLANTSFIPIAPIDNSLVYKDSVEFKALNPHINYQQKSVKVILEFDTNKQFNSPIKQTFVNNNLNGTVTKFKSSLPVLSNNTLFFWRTNSIINNDTSDWSKVQIFIYNNGNKIISEKDAFINASISANVKKFDPDQFSPSDFYNTYFDDSGIKLNNYSANLFVKSYGSNSEEASYFTVGDRTIYIDGGRNAGLNMIKVKKLNGSILEFKNFKMTSSSSSDSVVTFLNTFDTTHYLMLLNAAYVPGGLALDISARNKLRQFGSIYCDSIGLIGYFHTWSLIGYLGADASQVSEMFDPCCRSSPGCVSCDHWTPSISSLIVTFSQTDGSVSNFIGPAHTWTDFSWNQILISNSSLLFDVIGIDRNGIQNTLITNVQTNNFVDLSSIDAFQFPRLNLLAKFFIDTLIGTESSILNSIKVNYTPSSELVLDKNSLEINPNLKNKNSVHFQFDYHNAGYVFLQGIIVNLYRKSISDSNLILTDTVSSLLKTDSTKSYSNNFTSPNFRDSMKFYIYIKPKGNFNEFYTYNDTVDFGINSSEINIPAVIEVFNDGNILKTGDYVRSKPEIKISIARFNSSITILSDTSQVALSLNNKSIPYFINGNANPLIRTLVNDNRGPESNLFLYYYPTLEEGLNKLAIMYKDESDNIDTVTYDVLVSNELLVKGLYNYPNPMREETNFIFNLAGSTNPGKFKIKIYSVSGRLIKEIKAPVNIGYNQISWDGRDSDGDFIANGTYLYKLIAEDDSKIETQIEKLVVLR